jgi:hypothetical protein
MDPIPNISTWVAADAYLEKVFMLIGGFSA